MGGQGSTFDRWTRDSLKQIETASRIDVISGVNPSGAALSTLANAASGDVPIFTGVTTVSYLNFSTFSQTLPPLTTAAAWRTALGAAASPGSGTFLVSTNNLNDVASAATSRTNLGLGSAATHAATDFLETANNLSDLANAATARTNLGVAYGLQSIWVSAGAMLALPGLGTPPTGPNLTVTPTHTLPISGWDFAPGVAGYVGFDLLLPKSWDQGNISMLFWMYQIGAGAGNVVWQAQGSCLTSGATADVAVSGAATNIIAGGAAGSVYKGTDSSFALGGTPAADCVVPIYVLRNGSAGTDTLNATVRLLGARITYNTNANNDT